MLTRYVLSKTKEKIGAPAPVSAEGVESGDEEENEAGAGETAKTTTTTTTTLRASFLPEKSHGLPFFKFTTGLVSK